MTGRRKSLFAAMAMLVGTSSGLILLEVGLRLLPPAWLEQRMRELNVGQPYETEADRAWPIMLEGQAFRQFVPRSSFMVRHYEYQHAATSDELGGRTTPYTPGYRDVVPFMGDSFTFGVGVEDAETFVSLIAAEASRQPPSRVPSRLLNLGMTGTALPNQLDTLELRHEELGSPEVYVFSMFMGNDLTNIRRRYQRSALDGSARVSGKDRRWIWRANVFVYRHPVLRKLYAIQFLRQKLLTVMNRGATGFMDPLFLAMRTDLSYLDDSLVFLRKELARLTEISSRLAFDAVLLLIPDVHQLDATRRAGKAESFGLSPDVLDARQITLAISRALDEFHILYLDIGPCLAEAAIGELYYTQDTHFTAAGHARAARCIQRSGLLDAFTTLPAADRSVAPAVDLAP